MMSPGMSTGCFHCHSIQKGARLPNLNLPVLNEMFILHQVLINLNITLLQFARIEEAEGPGLSQS